MVWPAIISAGASLLGGAVSAFGQSRAQDRSEDFSREMYEYALLNGPSLEMAGLRRAGINPMLRYGSGGSGTPVSMPTMNFGNAYGDLGSAISGIGSSAYGALTAEQNMEESRQRVSNMEIDALRVAEETRRIRADTSLTWQQRENAVAEQGRILQQTLLGVAEEQLRYAQENLSEAQAVQAAANVRLLNEQVTTERSRQLVLYWDQVIGAAEGALRDARRPEAEAERDLFDSAYGRFLVWLRETREASGIGGSAAGVVGNTSVHGSIR